MVQQRREPHLAVLGCLSHTVQPAVPACPAPCPVRVWLVPVLLGQRPSLHPLLRPSLVFVRRLRRYYGVVRLPAVVPMGLMALRFLPPLRPLSASDNRGVSRFSRVKFLCRPGVFDSAGPALHSRFRTTPCCLPVAGRRRRPGLGFRSSLLRDTLPAYAPVPRFGGSLAGTPAWFGVRMVRYSFPV
jgi:hypothetical protein